MSAGDTVMRPTIQGADKTSPSLQQCAAHGQPQQVLRSPDSFPSGYFPTTPRPRGHVSFRLPFLSERDIMSTHKGCDSQKEIKERQED